MLSTVFKCRDVQHTISVTHLLCLIVGCNSLTLSVSLPLPGKWAVEQLKENIVPGDQGLVLKSRAKHHAIAALLAKPFVFEEEPLVLQYVIPSLQLTSCKLLILHVHPCR